MDHNLFTDKQIEYLYSDSGFLTFINRYFSSFSTYIQEIDYKTEFSNINHADWEIYLRIILANIETLHTFISDLESCLSMAHADKEETYTCHIQGRLNAAKFTKSLAQRKFPKNYPCVVKAKTYVTPENVYVIFIIKNILETLDGFKRFLKAKGNTVIYSELSLIENHLKAFRIFSAKAYFKECQQPAEQIKKSYGVDFPLEYINRIHNRIQKRKIRNSLNYQKIFDWYKNFTQGSFVESNATKLNILRYSNDFANKLFELWCLYSIKQTFISEFNATLIEENNIMGASDEYIFKLFVPTGGILEIYYQKGSRLYWQTNEELIWKYHKNGQLKGLKGIPDISIRYLSKEDSLIMIDVKNRVRNLGANTEEIYKMIGYFTNFRKAFEERYSKNVKKQGALIFRNDWNAFDELLESENSYKLMTLSAGIGEQPTVNLLQFKKLCKFILDVQGIDGATSEIMGSFSQAQKNNGIYADANSDEYIYIN